LRHDSISTRQGGFRATEPVAVLPMIARAVWDARYLKFRYGEGDGSLPRKVGPLGLVLKGGVWYLVAQKGNAFRTYRVGRISGAEALSENYPRPPKFDLGAWWAKILAGVRNEHLSRERRDSLVAAWPRAL
jgi:predicted DNA-binding transcriptional regulator YafY